MKLYRVTYAKMIDPWGKSHHGYHRLLETIEVEENGKFSMFDNGYTEPYKVPHWEAADGREWVQIDNRLDYWGGRWYKPKFEEPRDPALDKHEIGPIVHYLDETKIENIRLVNYDGKPVNVNGERLV